MIPDHRYQQAKQVVYNSENFTIRILQIKLSIGYNEAAIYMQKMVDDGIVNEERNKLLIYADEKTDDWIGIDLDGTLAHYDEWRGIEYIGKAIAIMLDFVKFLLLDGKKVKIFTARVFNPKSIPFIREWLREVGLPELEITNIKDFGMIMLYDDRCIQVVTNSGEIVKKTGE